jgi:acetyl-CoA carboxylase beta subunit
MDFKDRIKEYLDKRASKDALFAKELEKKEKSLDKCCKYITEEARKQANGNNCVVIDDETVFGWAVHYYDEDNLEVDKSETKMEKAKVAAQPKKATIISKPKPQPVQEDEEDDGEGWLFD